MKNQMQNEVENEVENGVQPSSSRRSMLKTICGASAAGVTGVFSFGVPEISFAAALTKAERDKMTPDDIVDELKKGNQRFRSGKLNHHDYLAQKRASAEGQYPSALVLSCIDSRAPAEIIFDTGIGETFVARVAGNISNKDIIGSMEFACAVSGAKVIVVMGHTACGAIKGAIDNAKLGDLTGLLEKIKPAIEATDYPKSEGKRDASNAVFVDKVAKTNVQLTLEQIRKGSQILRNLEKEGKLKMVGAMYNLDGGKVDFFS